MPPDPGAAKLCLNIIPHGIIFPGHDEINTAVFHVHLQHFDLHRVTQPVGVAGVGSRQAVTVFNVDMWTSPSTPLASSTNIPKEVTPEITPS